MIDTHCHLDDVAYADDLPDVVLRAKDVGIKRIIVPGTEVESVTTVRQVCRQFEGYAFPAIGLHPENIKEEYKDDLAVIHKALVDYHDWVAIGEIGLDYHFDKTFMRQQEDAFLQQLEWARESELPVLIHSRDATADMEAILTEAAKQGNKGIVHCFSGSYETACKYLDYDWKLGIGGVLTFKNSKLGDVLERVPLESLVLETDGPYLAPTPHRGKRNESSYIPLVIARLAEIYRTTPQYIEEVTDYTVNYMFKW